MSDLNHFTHFINKSVLLLPFIMFSHPCLADPGNPQKLPTMIDNTRDLRTLMQSDPHRPTYHFVAPEGHALPFDPNGAIYWKGKYHLGYIYQKLIDDKKQHVWGHAVSTDLLHWTIYPDMLDVKDGDMEKGIFSGGAFLSKEGVPHIVYYGLGATANLMAQSTDDNLKVWEKLQQKNALTSPEKAASFDASVKYTVFDPDAWYDKKNDVYYQISGGIKPALFKSKDMSEWKYLGDLIDKKHRKHEFYEDIACPDLFDMGQGKSMLLFISHTRGTQYYVGTFSNDKFTPEQHGRMNWPGGTFFAPEQLQDDKGRNIIWGWVTQPHMWPSTRQGAASSVRDYGWSGIMSMPRVVSLDNAGALQINPPEEMKSIRLNAQQEKDIILPPNKETTLRAQGKSIELKIEIAGGQSPFGVKVFASPDGQEETVIRYEPDREELVIDFERSAASGPVSIPVFNSEGYDSTKSIWTHFTGKVSEQRAPLTLKKGETLKLDIFLDRSIIEVFANGRQVVTQVVYPEQKNSTGVKVFSGNEAVTVKNIQSWQMAETNAF